MAYFLWAILLILPITTRHSESTGGIFKSALACSDSRFVGIAAELLALGVENEGESRTMKHKLGHLRQRSHPLIGLLAAPLFVLLVVSSSSGQEERLRWPTWFGGAFDRNESGSEANEIDEIEDFLETDRNSFTLARKTAGYKRIVFETAYTFLDPPGEGNRHSFPEILTRYGVSERLEIRLGWNNEVEFGGADEPAEAIISNFFGSAADQQLLYGIKYQLTRQDGRRPESALLVQGHTPTGGRLNTTQPRIAGVFGWRLPNDWNIDSAFWFGPDSELGDHFTIWAPSVVVRIPLGRRDRWFTHAEYFSVMSRGLEEDFSKHFVDTGLHYFITPNFEVGSVVAFGINKQSDPIVVNVGLGFRY